MKILLSALGFLVALNTLGQLKKNPDDFLPKGFTLFEKIKGDLNKDGIEDIILITKKIDKKNIVNDQYKGELDQNRRGIIVLFRQKDQYALAIQNLNCFSSENEDGGIYYAPELEISIHKGHLYISYKHGRYGYWTYTFRFKDSDFELIGFDWSENNGPIIISETSINFLTKKKITKKNSNESAESGEEVLKTTTQKINYNKPIKLSEIKDFDQLDMSKY